MLKALIRWFARFFEHDPQPGDVFRSGDWTTTVWVASAVTIRGRPGYGVVIQRGTEVRGGEMEHAMLVELVRGYRLASRGAE